MAPPLHYLKERDHAEQLHPFFQTTARRPQSNNLKLPMHERSGPSLSGLQHVWFYCSFHFYGRGSTIMAFPESKCGKSQIKQEGSFGKGLLMTSQTNTEQGNDKADSSLFAHLRAANEHFLPHWALKFLQRSLKKLFCFLTHQLLCFLICQALSQGCGISLLLHVVPVICTRWKGSARV